MAGQDVFTINSQGRVILIDALSGEIKWSTMTGCRVLLAVTPSRLYLVTSTNDLMVIDRGNGAIVVSPGYCRTGGAEPEAVHAEVPELL